MNYIKVNVINVNLLNKIVLDVNMTSCQHVHNVGMGFILVMESVINVREIVNLVCLRVHVRNVMMVTFWCLLTGQELVNVNYVTTHAKHD